MTRLLLVEDDGALREGLRDTFADEGYDVTVAADGASALDVALTRHFDVVVLDVMLPMRSGYEVLRALRDARLTTPVLLLTAKGDEADKVLGLDLGADDHVTKPFGTRELVARVRALLRRHDRTATAPRATQQVFVLGRREIDLGAFEVRIDGKRVEALSPKEAGMLALLFAERGLAVRRERILDLVWGSDAFVGPRAVDTHVVNLRTKVEDDPKAPLHLLTVHGVGYRLVVDRGPDGAS
ncbi:MAG: response regulator transcription factor [Planctomycetes bacterium]|nr:response regulator transcription factor [Planctomycetota bacterium]